MTWRASLRSRWALWIFLTAMVVAVMSALGTNARAQTEKTPAPASSVVAPKPAVAAVAQPAQPSALPSSSPSTANGDATSERRRGATDALPCSACHTTNAWRSKGSAGGEVHFDHATTGFPLTGMHAGASCVDCHDASRKIERACVSCHQDFHRGRLSQSCDTCHSSVGWHTTKPLEIHRMTRFPLTGMHVLADCTECHQRASEHRWTGAPVACFACHEKDYRRTDLRPVHTGSATTAPFPRDCSLCHRAVAWVPAILAAQSGASTSALVAAPPNHDLRFPLSFGVHRTATCDDCHTSTAAPRAVRCIGCHAHDPVRILQQHRTPVATDGASCMSCHPGGTRR